MHLERLWAYHGQRKRIFPFAWKLNIDFEIEHLHALGVWNGIGLRLAHPRHWRNQRNLVGSGIPVWMADGSELCTHGTDNVTNIQTLPPRIYLSLKLTGPVPCKSIFIASVY